MRIGKNECNGDGKNGCIGVGKKGCGYGINGGCRSKRSHWGGGPMKCKKKE